MYNSEPYEFFMLRRAAMPYKTILAMHEQCGGDFQKWESALLDLFQSTPLGKAIYLASPTLYAALDGYDRSSPEKARKKILLSAYKYLIRMCSRATPFGTFAVTSTGQVSERTKLSGPAVSHTTEHVLLKMSVLTRIAGWIEKQQHLEKNIRYYPNTTLYQTKAGYRFIDSHAFDGSLVPALAEIEGSAQIDLLVQATQPGVTRAALAQLLNQHFPGQNQLALVQAAIQAGLLVSEVSANVTGEDFQHGIKSVLARQTGFPQAEELHSLIAGLSKETGIDSLKATAEELSTHFPELSGQPLFRAQLTASSGKASLGKTAVARLTSDFNQVRGLLQENRDRSQPFAELKRKFRLRYGNRQVPLCELMESEIAMQYAGVETNPSTLLAQLEFKAAAVHDSAAVTATGRIKQKIFDRAASRQLYWVSVLQSDLAGLEKAPQKKSGHFILGEMLAASGKNIDRGYFEFHFKAAGGQSGLELMARFAQHDQTLAAQLKNAAAHQASYEPETIHAETAHIADMQTATVLTRPHLWPYEIPYLSRSTLPESNQIPINDLLVSLADSGEMILTSKRTSKRIIPHNTTAHNYGHGLPVYQLLSDLAYQQTTVSSWSWEHLETFTFLPRVIYGHLILSPARWNLAGETRAMVLDAVRSAWRWATLRKQLRIPRFIQICQADNLLLIDCENHFASALLGQELEKNEHLQIQECLQTSPCQPVKGKDGKFVQELLLAIKPDQPPKTEKVQTGTFRQRLFHLGSKWLYVKIVTGSQQADPLLTGTLAGLIQQLTAEGYILKWFFVRYNDPCDHLRLRFELVSRQDWQLVLSKLLSALEEFVCEGIIEKIQPDTYERELERYHTLDFEQSESIFHFDSAACVKAIPLLQNETQDQGRWQAALYSMDLMLEDFGLDLKAKADFAQKSYQDFLSEFGQDQVLTQQLDRKYRVHRDEILQALDGKSHFASMLAGFFKLRSEKVRELSTAQVSVQEISSYVHMAVNRILESNHRKQEMILFHFLKKYYYASAKRCTNQLNN